MLYYLTNMTDHSQTKPEKRSKLGRLLITLEEARKAEMFVKQSQRDVARWPEYAIVASEKSEIGFKETSGIDGMVLPEIFWLLTASNVPFSSRLPKKWSSISGLKKDAKVATLDSAWRKCPHLARRSISMRTWEPVSMGSISFTWPLIGLRDWYLLALMAEVYTTWITKECNKVLVLQV